MRSAPAARFRLSGHWPWWSCWCAAAAILVSELVAWLLLHWSHDPWPARAGRIVICLAAVVTASLGLRHEWPPRQRATLAWDGARWSLQRPGATAATAGWVTVPIDLGRWMLLAFEADTTGSAARRSHHAVGQRQLPTEWHALRCAVHAPGASRRDPQRRTAAP